MVDGANQTFYSAAKNAKFSVFKTCKMAVAGQNTQRPPARQKIIVNQSKPILVIVSIKPFTCKILFHAKLSGRFLLRQPLKCFANIRITHQIVLGSTQKFRRVDWTINLSLIAKFLVLGSIGDHWS